MCLTPGASNPAPLSKMSEKPLKRLGFVASGANLAYTATANAEKLYKSARSYTPGFVQQQLIKIEDTVAAVAAPVVAKAQDLGDKALHIVDDQVDYVLKTVDYSLGSVKQIHTTNMKTFSQAAGNYYENMTKLADYAVEHANPVKGLQAARETLGTAIAKAKEGVSDPDAGIKMAWDAWVSFSSIPAVHKVLETADPATKVALNTFHGLHDYLVANPLYKRAVDTGSSALGWAISTTPYKLGAQYVYPLVAPMADPAINKVTNSKYINEAYNYWKPTAAA